MKYRVPAKTVTTQIFIVEADSAEEAMNLVLDGDDEDYCRLINTIDGDTEVYYPDITEEKDE